MTESQLTALENISIPVKSEVFNNTNFIIAKDGSGMLISYKEHIFPIAADCVEIFATDFAKEIQAVWEIHGKK